MKTMIAILALTVCGTTFAQTAPAPRKAIIFCTQSEPLDADEYFQVRIDRQKGRAADLIHVDLVDATDTSKSQVIADQMIEEESGSFQQSQIVYGAREAGQLSIFYPNSNKKLNYLPSVYIGKKDGKTFAVPMRCTHL